MKKESFIYTNYNTSHNDGNTFIGVKPGLDGEVEGPEECYSADDQGVQSLRRITKKSSTCSRIGTNPTEALQEMSPETTVRSEGLS